jgi:hypothetical protein
VPLTGILTIEIFETTYLVRMTLPIHYFIFKARKNRYNFLKSQLKLLITSSALFERINPGEI